MHPLYPAVLRKQTVKDHLLWYALCHLVCPIAKSAQVKRGCTLPEIMLQDIIGVSLLNLT